MPQRAMSAVGLGGNMELTDEIKQKYKPFDWTQHHEDVFAHVDDEMKQYVTGQKTREWEQQHSDIKVAEDPSTAKPKTESKALPKRPPASQSTSNLFTNKIEDTSMSTSGAILDDASKGQILDSSNMDGASSKVQVYDEPLSEYGSATTIPPRRTKRDVEADTAKKSNLGFDDEVYQSYNAESQKHSNPFQAVLDKIDQQQLSGGITSNLDFSDLLNYEDLKHDTAEEEEEIWQARTKDGILVSWHDSLHSVDGSPALFICHEFFDALPISHFEFRPHGWVETVVDVDDEDETPEHFKLIRGPVATFASTVLDRQFAAKGIKPSIGQQFSICSQGNEVANHIAKWVGKYGGAGFIIDYGSAEHNLPAWTVQGIKEHKPTNILSKPGEVDISAHVNFAALQAAIEAVDGVRAFGPVTQSYFLQGCGIIERFRQYIKDNFDEHPEKDSEKIQKEKADFWNTFAKIMDIDKLGGHFKVLGFGKQNIGVPVGFRTPISESQAKTDEYGLPVYS